MNTTEKKNCSHNLGRCVREYNEVTGIHGFRYLSERRSRTEKIFWAIILLISLVGCIYMIFQILHKYENSPVVVSFATQSTPIYEIPFPAVTICPESKFSSDFFNYTKVYKKLANNETIEDSELKLFQQLSILCLRIEDAPFKNPNLTDDGIYDAIHKLKLNFSIMFPMCLLYADNYNCSDLFKPILIDEGICYSFNIFDREELFRDHVFQYRDYYRVGNSSRKKFDPEFGYKKNVGVNTYPRRALASGADNALTVFLGQNNASCDYMCNNVFQGFRVLLHAPWHVPRLSKHYFRIPFGKVVVAAIEPSYVTTSKAVTKFDPEKRKCYMRDERPLKHFQEYNQLNCLFECLINYTLTKCGCAGFYMPSKRKNEFWGRLHLYEMRMLLIPPSMRILEEWRRSQNTGDNSTAICGNTDCIFKAEEELQVKEIESRLSGHGICNCKPSCTNLGFNVETSDSDLYFKEYFFTRYPERAEAINRMQWSVLQVYFKEEQFMTVERNELYGLADLISNFGGLLGLFTGFSLISLVELIYFCSLRVLCNQRLYGFWSGPPRNV